MKLGLMILALLAGGYALLAIYGWISSDGQLFYPQFGSHREPKGLIRIPADHGTTLATVYLPNERATRVIWYFHGNAEDLGDLEPRLQEFYEKGYAVYAVEYPGYGLNDGTPTEASLYAATRNGLRYLMRNLGFRPDQIIAYGRSLGGGLATELAAQEPIGGLVLESAFASAFRVVTRWQILPFDKFANVKKLPGVKCPVLVMHGREDRVIPFSHGEWLFTVATAPKQNLWVDGAGHNDLRDWAGPRYGQALQKFIDGLPQVRGTERQRQ